MRPYKMNILWAPWVVARAQISQHKTIIFGGNRSEEGEDAWSGLKSWLQEKNERSNERILSLSLFFLPTVLLNPPLFSSGRWPSFSIAAIFVYGTSRLRKRRSDDVEASARGGCGRESEDVRPWGGQGRKTGGADLQTALWRGWRMADSVRREKTKKEGGKKRERRKETRNGQKDNIESHDREREGGIPEKFRNRRTGWRWSISRFRISKPWSQADSRFSLSLLHRYFIT